MADFEVAIKNLLEAEGGYAARDNNSGAVNFGITSSFLKQIGRPHAPQDVKMMTVDDARKIYQKYFWDAFKLGQIQDQRIAVLVFHMVVNNPAKVAIISLQLSLQDAGAVVTADGIAGLRTITAINGLSSEKRSLLIDRFKARMLDRYRRLAASNPKLYGDDLPGWEARLAAL